MIYYKEDTVIIRSMIEADIRDLAAGFAEQNWHKSEEQFKGYYTSQENGEIRVIVGEINGKVGGYLLLFDACTTGPFAHKGIPEIVDFNVLMKFQKRGVGSRLMDTAESLAKEISPYVSLSVGLHSGYGSAQRMYVKRGYIPDGKGLYYGGEPLQPYTSCENDDDLTLYFLKTL